MLLEQQEAARQTQAFLDFVNQVKKRVPRQPGDDVPLIPTPEGTGEDWVRSAWNLYGKRYLLAESAEALGLSMFAVLSNLRAPRGSEKWLSLGSGPGLYEIFLATRFPKVIIDSLDISTEQLRVQKSLIDSFSRPTNNLKNRILLLRGSMKRLDRVGKIFDQIFCLNSIHWCKEWEKAISEMSQVLSPKNGARVYVISGRARTYGNIDGCETAGENFDTDDVTNKFEEFGLRAKSIGFLKIPRGQMGERTERFFAVFERDPQARGTWDERVLNGETSYTNYEMVGNVIIASKLNEDLRR